MELSLTWLKVGWSSHSLFRNWHLLFNRILLENDLHVDVETDVQKIFLFVREVTSYWIRGNTENSLFLWMTPRPLVWWSCIVHWHPTLWMCKFSDHYCSEWISKVITFVLWKSFSFWAFIDNIKIFITIYSIIYRKLSDHSDMLEIFVFDRVCAIFS